jgi:winged helix DNA-binding protein
VPERERELTTRELNRALLARQLLLERSRAPLTRALEQLAGLQAQYAPSTYIRLWSSLDRFALGDLTRALERRRAVQATLMRSTIHVVSAGDFWLFAKAIRGFRLEWWRRTHGKQLAGVDMEEVSSKIAATLGDGVWHRHDLVELCRAHDPTEATAVWQGLPLVLVRVPPSGTWEHRRADLFATAESWLPASTATEADGLEHLLRRYLRGFGPARLGDAASWAGTPTAVLGEVADRLRMRTFRDEDGKKLLDLPRALLPDGDAPAPARFLPTFDATLLVHARRTQILPERFRQLVFNTKTPHSVPTFTVDGAVAGKWHVERSTRKATLVLEPFDGLPRAAQRDLRTEAERLVRFLAPDAGSHRVTRAWQRLCRFNTTVDSYTCRRGS